MVTKAARIGNDISNSHNARNTPILSMLIRTVITGGIFTAITTTRILSRAANDASSTACINTAHNITAITDMSDIGDVSNVSLGNLSSEVLIKTSDGGAPSLFAGEISMISTVYISTVFIDTVHNDIALHPRTVIHVSAVTLKVLTN